VDVFECCSELAVCCSVLQCVAVCCGVLQCVAVCCSVLQCVAVCCSVPCLCVLHRVACCSVLRVAVCCSNKDPLDLISLCVAVVLQCMAAVKIQQIPYLYALQCAAVYCSSEDPPDAISLRVAVCCNGADPEDAVSLQVSFRKSALQVDASFENRPARLAAKSASKIDASLRKGACKIRHLPCLHYCNILHRTTPHCDTKK